MTDNGGKYTASPRQWEQKEWLYEQYWAKLRTIKEIAARVEVTRQTILRQMQAHGVPRRPPSYVPDDHAAIARYYRPTTVDADTAVNWAQCAAD